MGGLKKIASRVPISKKKMDNSEVVTVKCRLEALEKMMESVAGAVTKMSEIPSFANPLCARPKIVVGAAADFLPIEGQGTVPAVAGVQVLGGTGQGGNRLRDRSPAVKRGYNDVAKDPPANGEVLFQPAPGRRRQPRKMTYGTNKAEGAEEAPIDVFVGNTNPRATEEIIK